MAYTGWLRNLVLDRDLPFYFVLSDLGRGAGDPFARVDMAIERVTRLERNREPFLGRFLFLDTDQLTADPGRAEQARRQALEHSFTVIWQDPTHEAFLLRHLPGHDTDRPPDKRTADAALAKQWADYRKPCAAKYLEQRLGLDGVRRVAAQLPALADLLRTICLLEG
jgi:hypothetical protein